MKLTVEMETTQPALAEGEVPQRVTRKLTFKHDIGESYADAGDHIAAINACVIKFGGEAVYKLFAEAAEADLTKEARRILSAGRNGTHWRDDAACKAHMEKTYLVGHDWAAKEKADAEAVANREKADKLAEQMKALPDDVREAMLASFNKAQEG